MASQWRHLFEVEGSHVLECMLEIFGVFEQDFEVAVVLLVLPCQRESLLEETRTATYAHRCLHVEINLTIIVLKIDTKWRHGKHIKCGYFPSWIYHDKLVEAFDSFEFCETVDEECCVVFTRKLRLVQCFQVSRQVVNALRIQELKNRVSNLKSVWEEFVFKKSKSSNLSDDVRGFESSNSFDVLLYCAIVIALPTMQRKVLFNQ